MGVQPQKAPKQPRDQVEVQVAADGSLRFAGQQMTLKDADAKFEELAKRDPPVELIVRSDQSVPYEKIKAVMDAAKAAGIKRMRQETGGGGGK
jgi:biopolymer transport protein ExbD/biopolymer transport protein TolR